MERMLELTTDLLWIAATSIGSIIIGILVAVYAFTFVKKKIQHMNWNGVLWTIVLLCPSCFLIYFGIQHNSVNLGIAIAWILLSTVLWFVGLTQSDEGGD